MWAVGADGRGDENLTDTPGVHEREPAFSPDGGRIAFSAGGDVWAMHADGTTRENLTRAFDEAFDERGYYSDEQSPSFSPDGEKIAFGAHLYGHSGDVYERCSSDVFAIGAGGGSAWTNLTRLPESDCSDDGWSAGSPAYSPDWQPVCPCPGVPPPNDAPTVTGARPAPGSEVRDRTPTIRAVVRDEADELAKPDITLRVDGRAKRFSYDPETDGLSRTTNKLSHGRHTVKVETTDGAGNTATKRWSFRVVKGR